MYNAEELNTKLYEKMKAEFDGFLENLKTLTPEEIISHSYEKVMKEDILACFEGEDDFLSKKQAKAILAVKYPLDDLYQEWLSNDYSHMEMLRDTISDRAESAVKAMNSRNKARESR